MNWFDESALTLAVFTPIVGMAIVLLIPKAHEQAMKVVALLTSLVTLGVGVGDPLALRLRPLHVESAGSRSTPRGST